MKRDMNLISPARDIVARASRPKPLAFSRCDNWNHRAGRPGHGVFRLYSLTQRKSKS